MARKCFSRLSQRRRKKEPIISFPAFLRKVLLFSPKAADKEDKWPTLSVNATTRERGKTPTRSKRRRPRPLPTCRPSPRRHSDSRNLRKKRQKNEGNSHFIFTANEPVANDELVEEVLVVFPPRVRALFADEALVGGRAVAGKSGVRGIAALVAVQNELHVGNFGHEFRATVALHSLVMTLGRHFAPT